MPDSDELDVFMALKDGVEETVIPGVLTSWAFRLFVSIIVRPTNNGSSRLKCHARALKALDEPWIMQGILGIC